MPIDFDGLPGGDVRTRPPTSVPVTGTLLPLVHPTAETGPVPAPGSPWEQVFRPHPEGGGPFGGRDNALVKLVGFLRAKTVPFEAGRLIALTWNREYCQPPLAEADVLDKVARAWAGWSEGGHDDARPATLTAQSGEIAFLTWDDMEEVERVSGAFRWILPNVLPETGLVYLSAPPAGGKTWLLLDLCRCLAHGGKWIGKYDIPATPTLYIDEEMGVRKILPRLRKLGMDRPSNFRYTNQAGVKIDNRQHVEQILAVCARDSIKVVVIDTLTRVHGKDENDNSQMRKLFDYLSLLLKAGLLVIIAHHDRKGGQGESALGHERMRGAGEIAASADMTYSVEKRNGYFHLECTKSRLVSEEDTVTVDFLVEDSPDRTRTLLRPLSEDERGERAQDKIIERIIAALAKDGAMNVTRMTQVVKGSPNVIVSVLDQMERAGRLVMTKQGQSKTYRLPDGRE